MIRKCSPKKLNSGPNPELCSEKDEMIFFDGYDIEAPGPEGSLDDCAKQCIGTANCEGFTFFPTQPHKGCYLKANFGVEGLKKKTARPDLVSGVVCRSSFNVQELPSGGYKYPSEGNQN